MAKLDAETFQHYAVDTPGTIREVTPTLSSLFVTPRLCDIKNPELSREVRATDPFITLPRTLLPGAFPGWVPPMMVYASQTTTATIVDYARKDPKKLLKPYLALTDEDQMYLPDPIPDLELDMVDVISTSVRIFEDIAEKQPSDSQYDLGLLLLTEGLNTGGSAASADVVSFFSNYDLGEKGLPSPEDIDRVREALKITSSPRWYIECTEAAWRIAD